MILQPAVELQPGDVFCVDGNMFLISRLIRWAEIFVSQDNDAHYGHAGIIASSCGDTIEALWTVKRSTLNSYRGQRIIIARPIATHQSKRRGIDIVSNHLGQWYPAWRLLLHLAPPLAKYLSTGRNLVCSELVAKYLALIGARSGPYTGINPDTLADMFIDWKNFDIVYEGVWQCPTT